MLSFNHSSRGSVLVEVPCQLGRLLFEEIQSKSVEMEKHVFTSKSVGLLLRSQDIIPRLCFTRH